MEVLAEFTIRNGAVTEKYSFARDVDGEFFVQCCLDTDGAGPIDTMHFDRRSLVPLAKAFLMADMRAGVSDAAYVFVPPPDGANVVAFRPGARAVRVQGMVS